MEKYKINQILAEYMDMTVYSNYPHMVYVMPTPLYTDSLDALTLVIKKYYETLKSTDKHEDMREMFCEYSPWLWLIDPLEVATSCAKAIEEINNG